MQHAVLSTVVITVMTRVNVYTVADGGGLRYTHTSAHITRRIGETDRIGVRKVACTVSENPRRCLHLNVNAEHEDYSLA